MPYLSEYELSDKLLSSVNKYHNNVSNQITLTDILSAQQVFTNNLFWIIYCNSKIVKEHILSSKHIEVESTQYELCDVQSQNTAATIGTLESGYPYMVFLSVF